jgi:hypothetical protein
VRIFDKISALSTRLSSTWICTEFDRQDNKAQATFSLDLASHFCAIWRGINLFRAARSRRWNVTTTTSCLQVTTNIILSTFSSIRKIKKKSHKLYTHLTGNTLP